MAINMKQKERKNRYVWRWDFSLPETDNENSEIGREVRKHIGFYKAGWLLIGGSCLGVLLLMSIVLLICHAELIYIRILGFAVFLLGLMYVKVLKIPKITVSDIKNWKMI